VVFNIEAFCGGGGSVAGEAEGGGFGAGLLEVELDELERWDEEVRGAFVVGGFVFSRSEILREVPYDPHLYFNQEEAAYGLRLFTHGWDLFSPTQVVVYHYYNPGGPQTATVRPLHWNDSPNWARLDQLGLHRYYHLTGARPSTDPRVTAELDRFGLGRARTVAQFEAYAGVDFRDRRVLERAFRGEVAAPVPIAVVATPGAAAPPTTVASAAAAHAERRPPRFAPPRAETSLRPGAFVPSFSLRDAAARTHDRAALRKIEMRMGLRSEGIGEWAAPDMIGA